MKPKKRLTVFYEIWTLVASTDEKAKRGRERRHICSIHEGERVEFDNLVEARAFASKHEYGGIRISFEKSPK